MTTTTMHFGPEWMRTKGSARPAPSPPLNTSAAPAGASSYSALVTPVSNPAPERRDTSNPFRYSREELLRIYKEGGGRGGLGLEVERWEGIVREVGYDPVAMKEMSEAEKKLFAGSLNSEIRRRQSVDVLSPLTTTHGERPKLGHAATAGASPMRERMGTLMGRRRDSTDQAPLAIPRKLSLSSMQSPLTSPRDAALQSPRTRIGHAPGFDGVLSESWSSRRRTSESTSKVTAGGLIRRETSESGNEYKGLDIKEEDEAHVSISDQQADPQGQSATANEAMSQSDQPSAVNGILNGTASGGPQAYMNSVNGGMAGLSLRNGMANMDVGTPGVDRTADMGANKPPGLPVPTDIEWSYLDPQGQIQGPFRADIMQRWHDDGYFSPELLMKRTHLDTVWTSIGEMRQRAGSRPIFLTPGLTSVTPPGLARRPDLLQEGPALDGDRNVPFQPVPVSTLRTSALDSYLQNGSSASASPSSSFGAARFVNGSPDRSVFEARTTNHLFPDSPVGPRLGGFPSMANSPLTTGPQRRPGFGEPFDSSSNLRPSFNGMVNGRGIDGLGFGGMDGTPVHSLEQSTSFSGVRAPHDLSLGNGLAGPSNYAPVDVSSIGALNGQGNMSRLVTRDLFGGPVANEVQSPYALGGTFANSSASFPLNGQHFPQNQSLQYQPSDGRSLTPLTPISERQASMSSQPIPTQQQRPSFPSAPSFTTSQSLWPSQGSPALRRPGPFDADYPNANNTIITGPSTTPNIVHGRSSQSVSSKDRSPWQTAPVPVSTSDTWTTESSSLTVENLGQHNERQQTENKPRPTNVSADVPQVPQAAATPPDGQVSSAATGLSHTTATLESAEPSRAAQKTRRKSSTQPSPATTQPAPSKVAPVHAAAPEPPSPTPVEPKTPWAKDDDSKTAKPAGATLSLREIQEAEMKKLEARKAAERDRERAARAANGAASPQEDFQPFTASWGLPTSQAGRAPVSTGSKDSTSTAATATTPTTPVWTNTAKPQVVKKSMKEIQEEEERRKKLAAKEKETVAAAAKRGYAETTTKSPAPPAASSGGAWTTVGTGGKVPGAAVTATRPAIATSNSAAKVVASASSSTITTPTVAVRVTPAAPTRPAMPAKATSSKADEFPAPPSHEFVKWLGDSLKGLNNSINLEDISSMLLSFPLDPDPSTVEIISDLIYASSTTLDGRRFASEFVSRRKADAAARSKNGAPVGASTKPLSIAEVVKTQPKPAQSEWGGFKVVNKKKKGGRT